MIPSSAIVILALNAVIGFALPVCLAWWLVKRHKARLSTILIGAATFFLFALVLESIVHQIVLNGPNGAAIQGNTLYYALYGGMMAGLFEETGRFLSMKFLMKKEPTETLPAIAYGAGHGGIEVILVFAVSMISSLILVVMVNAGQADALMAKIPVEAQGQLHEQLTKLETESPAWLLLGVWERLSALVLHLSFSVLVWAAVRKGGKWLWLFPAAILLHALVDGVTVILSKGTGMVVIELIVMCLAIAVAAIAWMVARKAFKA